MMLVPLPNESMDKLHELLCYAMIAAGACAFAALFFIHAPYGRFSQPKGWGPLVNAKLAWIIWESPSLVLPAVALASSPDGFRSLIDDPLSPRTLLYLCLTIHYTYRVLLFPLLTRGGKPAPLSVAALSFTYCCWNGFLQGYYLAFQLTPSSSVSPYVLAIGMGCWFLGWISVVRSDLILINLRKPGETGYKIPYGGLFEFVSAANYTSECFEWCGYATASGGALPCVCFAVFTFCNLSPRGVAHHYWYLSKFEDYPRGRKAIIPWLW
jgi:3-oxo-5-alpha-steroid 4-dehydrogenase 1